MTTNMLNLPSFKILDMKECEYDYRFLVETILLSPSYCPKCGAVSNLYKHGKKEQLFFDLPMHAKRVGIFVKRQRYKCRECDSTFFESLPDIDDGRSVTKRLINWIRQNVSAKESKQLMRDRYVLLTRRKDLNEFDDQIKLQVWTQNFPLLGQAYELKEQFFDIYEAKTLDEAYKLYQNWVKEIPKDLIPYFESLIKSMSNWEEEIFNYFDNPITNAYTES